MLFPCEIVVKKILPALKAQIVKELHENYKLKQQEIAKILGITQPSVSLYLSGERGGFDDILKDDKAKDELKKLDEISEKISKDKLSERNIMEELCNICMKLREDKVVCDLHVKLDKSKDDSCGFCVHQD